MYLVFHHMEPSTESRHPLALAKPSNRSQKREAATAAVIWFSRVGAPAQNERIDRQRKGGRATAEVLYPPCMSALQSAVVGTTVRVLT